MIARELRLALAAVVLLTRIPVPAAAAHPPKQLGQSARYFPLAGLLIGAIAALVYLAAGLVLPNTVAVVLALVAGVLASGAFHEDGFADVCDGFGAGHTREEVLRIMSDPHVGAFGASGIALMLLLRFAVLSVFEPAQVCAALLAGHAASRFYPVLLMRWLPYARAEGGKSRAFTEGVGNGEIAIAGALAVLPVCLLFPAQDWLAFLPPFAACAGLGWMFKARIGGYTGDCLGATQQVCEVTIYLSLVALAA